MVVMLAMRAYHALLPPVSRRMTAAFQARRRSILHVEVDGVGRCYCELTTHVVVGYAKDSYTVVAGGAAVLVGIAPRSKKKAWLAHRCY
jgi:hypothetical protein